MSVRKLVPLAAVAVPLCLLTACQTPSPAQRRLLDSMIGRTQVDLVRSFGVPSRTYSAEGHTFLAYVDNQSSYSPGVGPGWGWGWGGYGWGGGGFGYGGYGGGFGGGYGGFGGFPPTYYNSVCTTTFEVTGDRVASWSLRGDGC